MMPLPLPSFQVFDRIRCYMKSANIYRQDNLYQDQNELRKILGTGTADLGKTSSLLEQTNLQINRLERYKDYDMMDEVGEVNLALDIWADEGTLTDPETKHAITVTAHSKHLKKVIEDFLYNTIMIDREIRPMFRYLCKYGDLSGEIVPTKNRDGVSSFRLMDLYNFTRLQTKFGDLVGFLYQDVTAQSPQYLHPWQVVHMRLSNYEKTYAPYGRAVLDSARRDFKRLRLMEDAALIYRLTRAAIKRIFSIPVGNMDPNQIPFYMEYVARQFKKQRFVDPATGQVNERYNPLTQEDDFFLPKRCLTSGEKIPLLDGRIRTLGELITEYGVEKEKFWIYSWDGNIIPKLAHCVIGQKQSKMVRITLDNGEHIDCTPDHKFYLRDGRVVEAKDLQQNDSLVALYRRKQKLHGGKYVNEYEQVMNPLTGEWEFTHRIVKPDCPNMHVRHHINFNRFDNRPENLKIMNVIEHKDYHAEHGSKIMKELHQRPEMVEKFMLGTERGIVAYNGSDRARVEDGTIRAPHVSKMWDEGKYEHTVGKNHVKYTNLDDYKEVFRELIKKNFGMKPACREWNANPEHKAIWNANHNTLTVKIKEWGYESVEDFAGIKSQSNPAWRILEQYKDEVLELVAKSGPKKASKLFEEKHNIYIFDRMLSKFAKANGWEGGPKGIKKIETPDDVILNGIIQYGSATAFLNTSGLEISHGHCTNVIKRAGYSSVKEFLIKQQAQPIQTTQQSQPTQPVNHKVVSVMNLEELQDTYCLEVEDTHCFFLNAGVLVHNSDGTGPTIDTLQGAENLDQIADIEYFKKKMIAGLKIPFNRVGIGDPQQQDGKSLASSSPEFAKAIQWVQREMIYGLKKLVIVHLALAGFRIDDIKRFNLSMTSASAIDELYRIETWKSRADIIGALKDTGLFPPEWILSHFTNMTDEEIDDMQKLMKLKATGSTDPGAGAPPGMPAPDMGALPPPPDAGGTPPPGGPPGMPPPPGGEMPGGMPGMPPGGAPGAPPPGMPEDIAKLEKELITELSSHPEYKNLLHEVILKQYEGNVRRKIQEDNSNVEFYVNSNELNALTTSDNGKDVILVEDSIPQKESGTVVSEGKRFLNFVRTISEEKVSLGTEETQAISESL